MRDRFRNCSCGDPAATRPCGARRGRRRALPRPKRSSRKRRKLISLEDADAEAQGKNSRQLSDAEVVVEDVETDEAIDGDDDETFIEEQEEEDTDVTEIIGGDIEKEEET